MPGHAIIDLRSTYGCTFIGLVISIMLFGITVMQTWMYFWQYGKRDPKALKLFIVIILLLDTFHTTLCIYSLYWYLILNFGNVESLGYNMWAMNVQVDINGLVDFMVQLYYARRVYVVGQSIIIPAIIVALSTNCLVFGFVFTVKSAALKSLSRYGSLIWVTCVGLGSGVGADILIAFSMCWFLSRRRTGFAKTDSMIMTMITYSVNSGLITGILTTAVLITFVTANSSLIWELLFWPMGKFYANSLLAMLNSRDHVREMSSSNKADNAYNLTSLRVDQRSDPDQFKRTAVSVTVQRSATMDYPPGKHGHDVESTKVDISSLGASIPYETRGRMSESIVAV